MRQIQQMIHTGSFLPEAAGAAFIGVIGGVDGPTAALTADSGNPSAPIHNIIGLVVTLAALCALKRGKPPVAADAARPRQ